MEPLSKLVPFLIGAGHDRTAASDKREEARLERACAWGAGHVLVTAADRAEAHDLLERVLRRIDPLGTVRARACSPDPDSALDGVFALMAGDGRRPLDRRERRHALVNLVERARRARRSIFVVVDDGDDATIEQLERLRLSVEVTPEALERLRLVLLGGPSLVAKLSQAGARPLSSRITSRIRVGPAAKRTSRGRAGDRLLLRPAFAVSAGLASALLAYGVVRGLLPVGEVCGMSAGVMEPSASMTVAVATPAEPRRPATSLRGDEPFLRGPLQIPIHTKWTTGSALSPPPKPAAEAPEIRSQASAQPKSGGNVPRPAPPRGSAQPVPSVKVAAQLVEGTSIAALVARFR